MQYDINQSQNVLASSSDEAQRILKDAFDRFPWTDKKAYTGYLSQLHYYTSNSVRLLARMLSNLETTTEPAYDYLVHHISEESGHEQWALDDFKDIGGDLTQYPELEETRSMYSTQLQIADENPLVCFGYSHALERLSVERAGTLAEEVAIHSEKSNRFLKAHYHVDAKHCEAGDEQLELVPEELHELIAENMIRSANDYAAMLDSTAERYAS